MIFPHPEAGRFESICNSEQCNDGATKPTIESRTRSGATRSALSNLKSAFQEPSQQHAAWPGFRRLLGGAVSRGRAPVRCSTSSCVGPGAGASFGISRITTGGSYPALLKSADRHGRSIEACPSGSPSRASRSSRHRSGMASAAPWTLSMAFDILSPSALRKPGGRPNGGSNRTAARARKGLSDGQRERPCNMKLSIDRKQNMSTRPFPETRSPDAAWC